MDCQIPLIVVTPALPSRKSLPAEMRATLDAIIGPASPAKAFQWMRDPSGIAPHSCLGMYGDEGMEEPHAPSRAHCTVAGNAPRLEVHLENARFSVGTVVSALDATFRAVPAHDAASGSVTTDGTSDASSSRTPHARRYARTTSHTSYCSSTDSLLLASEIESRPEDIWEDASDEGDAPSTRAVRRAPPYGGTGNSTWRHAMYVSTLVWPLEDDGGRAPRRQPDTSARGEPVKDRFHWTSLRTLAGVLALGRTRVRHERRVR
ncbi:hypothetical protein TRAPUB_2869 [Trametes pubescens]|uniref:Uncharacterized protein n=1 Tax=Trametes pubescens TaxID=154538 RepID=A0A1M2VFA7_TRAPU|nr:hypothetical protein TRAPUB_2869 [Trametes pubescens]